MLLMLHVYMHMYIAGCSGVMCRRPTITRGWRKATARACSRASSRPSLMASSRSLFLRQSTIKCVLHCFCGLTLAPPQCPVPQVRMISSPSVSRWPTLSGFGKRLRRRVMRCMLQTCRLDWEHASPTTDTASQGRS